MAVLRKAYGFFRTRGNVRHVGTSTMTYAQDDDQDDERVAAILYRRASGVLAHDEALAELADADCAPAIAVAIAERVRLRADMVMLALEADSDEVISVMCRAAGFKMNSYSALLRMRRRHNRGREGAPVHSLTLFRRSVAQLGRKLLPRIVADLGATKTEPRRRR
jgi:hypothetical protein